MSARLLRSAVLQLATPAPGAGWLRRRVRDRALDLVLKGALRRRTLPALLAALDGAGAAAVEPADAGDLSRLRSWPATCLYRALATFAALRAKGADARFVIGLRRGGDLVAHAWVERDGHPVGEPVDPRTSHDLAYAYPPYPRRGEVRDNGGAVAALETHESVILTELQDGTGVLLHLGTKFYFALNRSGVVAWKLIAGGEARDAGQVAEEIVARFAGVTLDRARADVDALLAELRAEGLLATGEPS